MSYNIKKDYLDRLRRYLMAEQIEFPLYEDPLLYQTDYTTELIQGFLVWNHDAYLAKQYEFPDRPIDFFIIPAFGEEEEISLSEGTLYLGISIDMHKVIDQTGQRTDMVAHLIRQWHRKLIRDEIVPITLTTGETYVILGNGMSTNKPLTEQPYNRQTVRVKLTYLNSCPI